MPLNPFRSKILWILFLLVGVAIAGFLVFGGVRSPEKFSYGERAVLKVLGPVSKTASFLGLGLRKFWEHYIFLVHVKEKNEELQRKLMALEAELVRTKEIELENKRLRKLLKLAEQFPEAHPVAARVIGRPMGSWQGVIIIDRGLNDNILPEMPVLAYTDEGLGAVVGQVVAVERHYAKVLLLTDPSFAVDALVQRSRERGLLRGQGRELCLLDYVPAEADVRENDLVITSGMDALFPKGLLLGTVIHIYPGRSKGLFRMVEVRPAVNFSKLEEVLVLLRVRLR